MNTLSPLLRLDEVVVGYDHPIAGPLSFEIMPGELVALCGPNGSGKSSVLGAILNRVTRFSGHINRSPALHISSLDQHSPWPAELPLSGRDLLGLAGLSSHGLPAQLGLCLDRRLDRLSGGQRQLIRTWVAIHQPADLLLLDEPTNNLDPDAEQLLTEALCHRPANLAVLLVSHEPQFLASLPVRRVEMQ
ncbi:MAG: ATP-binding cassette domain-containing protein [Alcanivoracaceae bacterium]